MARWVWQDKSIGVARQADLVTAATTGFAYLRCAGELPDMVRSTEDFQFGTSQVGAYEPPTPGSKHGGKVTLSWPVQGLKSGYDGTSEAPYTNNDVLAYTSALMFHAIGGNTSGVSSTQDLLDGKLGYPEDYDATGTQAGATASSVTVAAASGGNYDEGNLLFVSTNASDTSPQIGYIKTQSTDTLTLFENAQNTSATSDVVWPTVTCPYTGEEPDPLTIRILGDQTAFGVVLVGCIPESWSLRLHSGMTPTFEVTYVYTDREWDTSIGGLQTKTAFVQVPPALGGSGAYMTVDGSSACLHELEISCTYGLQYRQCWSAAEGYDAVTITSREMSASFAVDHQDTDTITSTEHVWETKLTNQTSFSLGWYVGVAPGKVFTGLMPAWHVSEMPTLEDVDGTLYHRVTARPGEYSGDTGATKAADSIFRMSFG